MRGMARRPTGQPVAACLGCGGRVGSVGPTASFGGWVPSLQRRLRCFALVRDYASPCEFAAAISPHWWTFIPNARLSIRVVHRNSALHRFKESEARRPCAQRLQQVYFDSAQWAGGPLFAEKQSRKQLLSIKGVTYHTDARYRRESSKRRRRRRPTLSSIYSLLSLSS